MRGMGEDCAAVCASGCEQVWRSIFISPPLPHFPVASPPISWNKEWPAPGRQAGARSLGLVANDTQVAATRVPAGGDRACSRCNEGSRQPESSLQPLQRILPSVGIELAAAVTNPPVSRDRPCSRCNEGSRQPGSTLQPLQRPLRSAGIEHAAAATTTPVGGSLQSSHFWMLSHYV